MRDYENRQLRFSLKLIDSRTQIARKDSKYKQGSVRDMLSMKMDFDQERTENTAVFPPHPFQTASLAGQSLLAGMGFNTIMAGFSAVLGAGIRHGTWSEGWESLERVKL